MFPKKYLKIFNISFQESLEYRFNYFSGLVFSFIPFGTNVLFWFAVYRTNPTTGFGFNLHEMITYYFATLIVSNVVACDIVGSVSHEIRSGEICRYFIKPVDYMIYNFIKSLPSRITFVIIGTIPIVLLLLILKDYILISYHPLVIIYFLISLCIAFTINFLIRFIIGLSSFYLGQISNLHIALNMLMDVIAGRLFPLSLLPLPIYNIMIRTPFSFTGYYPTMILLGKINISEIITVLFIGVVWIIVLTIVCKLLWASSLKKYSAFGG